MIEHDGCFVCRHEMLSADAEPCCNCIGAHRANCVHMFRDLYEPAGEKEEVDMVNHPPHYEGDIECIDAMLQQYGSEAVRYFCKLNAFKYLWRCDRKHSDASEDVQKARWYLDKYTELGGV